MRERLLLYLGYVGFGGLLLSSLLTALLLPSEAGSVPAYITRQDFVGLYLGARLASSGQAAHLYDLTAQYQLQVQLMTPYAPIVHTLYFTYPGWVAMLISPLGYVDYPLAFWVWAAVNLLAACTTVGLLMKLAGRHVPFHERNLLFLAAAGFTPLWFALWQGQTPLFVCLGLVAALLALRSGHEYRAGAWLLLGLIKPQLIVVPLLVLVLHRRWRALAALVAGGCALLLASLLVLGNWVPSYLGLISSYVSTGAGAGDDPAIMHNWRGLIFRLLGTDTGTAGVLVAILTGLTLVPVVAFCWPGIRRKVSDMELCFAAGIVAGLLVDAHLYLHDAVVALVAGLILWRASVGGGRRLRVLRGVLLLGPFIARLALSWAPPFIEIGSWYLVLLLLTLVAAWPLLTSSPSRAVTAESLVTGIES